MTSGKFLRTQELECLLAVDTICGHLKYWGVFCIVSVYYTGHSTTLFNISVLATGSIVYQCMGHWEYTVSVYWPHSKCPKSELWQLGKQQGRTNCVSFLCQETVICQQCQKKLPIEISKPDIPNNGKN